MNKPNFTFVVPVHNGIKFIKECIDGILYQNYQNFDVAILENASNDGTAEYLASLKDKRIKIYPSGKLLTIEENWTRILDTPREEYMVIACADDCYHSNYLNEIVKLINKHPKASLYRTNIDIINSKSEFISSSNQMKEKITEEQYLKGRLSHTYFETVMGYCMRTKDYDEVGGIDCIHNLLHPDDVLFMKLTRKSYLVTSKAYACCYRSHEESVSASPNSQVALEGYNYFFNYIHSLNNIKLINIVRKYLPLHIAKISKFYTKEQVLNLEKMYILYKINPNNFIYKLRFFIANNFSFRREKKQFRIKFFKLKTKIKLLKF